MFSCRCETYLIDFISLPKALSLSDIKIVPNYLFNGNKKPIRYEFHNGIKPNRYNGNMALQNIDEQLLLY